MNEICRSDRILTESSKTGLQELCQPTWHVTWNTILRGFLIKSRNSNKKRILTLDTLHIAYGFLLKFSREKEAKPSKLKQSKKRMKHSFLFCPCS